jgi:hypothetical protein
MLNNIYDYSEKHEYIEGLFFIGAAHRKSIISKIESGVRFNDVTAAWNISNYDDIF